MGLIPPSLNIFLRYGYNAPPGQGEWRTAGPKSDPTIHLSSTWNIGGTDFHVEAIRVAQDDTEEGEIQQVDVRDDQPQIPYELGQIDYLNRRLDKFSDCFSGDGPFDTVDIGGADYVLFISPFRD